jgi:hypothetical protein
MRRNIGVNLSDGTNPSLLKPAIQIGAAGERREAVACNAISNAATL